MQVFCFLHDYYTIFYTKGQAFCTKLAQKAPVKDAFDR